MDLTITYLGFKLKHPLMPGASPLVDDLDNVKALEDAGAQAIVMHSLFEEQLTGEEMSRIGGMEEHAEAHAEAASYHPSHADFQLGPDEYLEQVRRIKVAVSVPCIASLNGVTLGGWLEHGKLMQEAGADAIELNVYELETDPEEEPDQVERRTLEMVTELKRLVTIPLAVKVSPYYTALANMARKIAGAGADGLVLFNRFYQPDLDLEELEVVRELSLSTSEELLPRLRWIAILAGRIDVDIAVTGGVHTAEDAIKAVMTGAQGVQLVSALLRNGPGHLAKVRKGMEEWLEEHEYDSLAQAHGSMSLIRSPNPKLYARANYINLLQCFRG